MSDFGDDEARPDDRGDDGEEYDDGEFLELWLSWPVSTGDGEPAVTSGLVTVSRRPDGGLLLEACSGVEDHPAVGDGERYQHVQMPLPQQAVPLLMRALSGERVGGVNLDR